MLEKLSWLHLSDLHLRANKDKFSQEVLCEAIKRDVPSRLSDEFPVQFIFVTGDIAFSGQSSEYEVSTEFLSSLSSDLELETSRLCIVPGNHDVDRSLQTYMYEGVKLRLNNQQAVDEFLARSEERTQLMERQSAFRDFRRRMSPDNPSSETHDGLAHVQRFEINGLRVSVLELNTAWLSGNKDRLATYRLPYLLDCSYMYGSGSCIKVKHCRRHENRHSGECRSPGCAAKMDSGFRRNCKC